MQLIEDQRCVCVSVCFIIVPWVNSLLFIAVLILFLGLFICIFIIQSFKNKKE